MGVYICEEKTKKWVKDRSNLGVRQFSTTPDVTTATLFPDIETAKNFITEYIIDYKPKQYSIRSENSKGIMMFVMEETMKKETYMFDIPFFDSPMPFASVGTAAEWCRYKGLSSSTINAIKDGIKDAITRKTTYLGKKWSYNKKFDTHSAYSKKTDTGILTGEDMRKLAEVKKLDTTMIKNGDDQRKMEAYMLMKPMYENEGYRYLAVSLMPGDKIVYVEALWDSPNGDIEYRTVTGIKLTEFTVLTIV